MNGKILIVDDEPSAVATMEATFSSEAYDLEVAHNGVTALEKADSSLPDLILLDAMMPGMDGFEVCRRLRNTPRLAEVPIIILTALDDRDSRLRGIEVGADDFISKPVDRQELRLRVRTILRLNRYRTLLTQRENLREMARHVVNAQEEERRRISRELHDDIGQALIAHLLSLRNLQMESSPTEQTLQTQLDALISETHRTLDKMRLLAHDLRPTILDTLGLKSSMETYCQEFSSRTNLPVLFEIDPDFPELSDVYSITLYRFLQEALTNVVKHSSAKQVWVEVIVDGNHIVLSVQDNGSGLPTIDTNAAKGIGISGLRERLTIVGGEMTINSSANGTIISAHLPLEEKSLSGEIS